MAYVVTESCIGHIEKSCLEVCPVDCYYYIDDKTLNDKVGRGPNPDGLNGMLVINPEECIDCGACVSECPHGAIFSEDEVPEELSEWVKFNESAINDLGDDLESHRASNL